MGLHSQVYTLKIMIGSLWGKESVRMGWRFSFLLFGCVEEKRENFFNLLLYPFFFFFWEVTKKFIKKTEAKYTDVLKVKYN